MPETRYRTLPPPPALADIVRFFWVFEIKGIAGQPYVYRSMADACAELIFHYQGTFDELTAGRPQTQGHSMLQGQSSAYRRFVTHESFSIFGAYIYPSALPRLLGHAAHTLTNEMPDLITLWGNDGRILEEQIMLAATDQARATILSDFLFKRIKDTEAPDPRASTAIRTAIHSGGLLSVSQMADRFNLSVRQLERKFQAYAGFSPKTYTRILRFQAAMSHFGHSSKTLTDIALDCGYYDQAHFIHDFKAFSGYRPSDYFFGRPEGIEYREA